jgi:hypothetical protein
LQFIIAGYFLFNSTFIHAHFLAKLSADLNEVELYCFELSSSDEQKLTEPGSVPAESKKKNSNSADELLYYQIMTMAGHYLLMPIDFRLIKKIVSFLRRFFVFNNSPPDIFQFYLFRGPPSVIT